MTKIVWRRKKVAEVIRREVWIDRKKVASYKSEAEIAVARVLFAGRNMEVKQVLA